MSDSLPPQTSPSDASPACKPSCAQAIAARLTNGLYYLSVGTWFGAIVMLAIAAAAAFKTMRGYDPILPGEPWNHPELADRAPVILAGAVVGASLAGLKVVQIICAIGACLAALLQCTVFARFLTTRRRSFTNVLRLLLLAIPVAMLLLNIFYITPRIIHERDTMWDMQQTEQVRQASHDRFQIYHKLSERTTGGAGFCLAATALLSSLVLGSKARKETARLVTTQPAND